MKFSMNLHKFQQGDKVLSTSCVYRFSDVNKPTYLKLCTQVQLYMTEKIIDILE